MVPHAFLGNRKSTVTARTNQKNIMQRNCSKDTEKQQREHNLFHEQKIIS